MMLLTEDQKEKLKANHVERRDLEGSHQEGIDFFPVVKLIAPNSGAKWLLTELDPENEDIVFGLCDLGDGSPELGYLSLAELASLRWSLDLPVERDRSFEASQGLLAYAESALKRGRIAA